MARRKKRRNRLGVTAASALATTALLLAGSLHAQDPIPATPAAPATFQEFLAEIRTEALSQGIGPATVDAALHGLIREPVVVTRDRAQPESVVSLDQYVLRRTGARTVSAGRTQLRQHGAILQRVERSYGVPPAIVVAIWGLESNFGRFTGTYPTVRALATLAYDGRRPLFRRELLQALTILDRGDVPLERLKGSWAGAMGQPQFMPSSYLEHAVDFDADGHADIWTSTSDVFGSMANYLKNEGWTSDLRWGREVAIPGSVLARIDETVPMRREGCRAVRELTDPRPLKEWTTLGVRLPGGDRLPSADVNASLVRGTRRYFLVYGNYEALLSYNCSNAYAVSVGVLADKIGVK